jgi:hypothetical protein
MIDETPQDTRDEPIIVALAEKFRVSAQNVKAIYGKERRRLESGARIQSFLDVLAIASTRTILRNLEHTSGELH